MKKISRRAILFLFLSFFLCPGQVFAGFGISPSGIYHEHLKPGSTFEQKFIISRSDPDEDLIVLVEPELEEIEDWFSFEPGKRFKIPKGEQRVEFKAIVSVPEDAPYGEFKGLIRMKATPDGEDATGISVVKGARMEVELLTTDLGVTDLLIRNIQINQIKGDEPIRLMIKVENTGNLETSPNRVVLEIRNLNGELLETLEITDLEKIASDETKEITAELETDLGDGDYFVDTKVFLDNKLLREERLVLGISGRGKKEAEPKGQGKIITSLKESAEKLKSLAAKPLYFLVGLPLVAIIVLMVKKIKKSNKKDKKKYVLALVILAAVALIIGGLILAFKLGRQSLQEESLPEESSSEINQEREEASVKGVIFEAVSGTEGEGEDKIEDVLEDKPVGELKTKKMRPMVFEDSGESRYRIYEKPDLESQIVFAALEGETFAVLEEQAEWYRVELPDGTDGWLPKASVKSD